MELAEAGVRAVVLIGGGEPLMHRSTPRIAQQLTEAGVAVGLVTNGTLLRNVIDLLVGNLSWLRVSLDAATAPTYLRVRPGRRGANRFGLVTDNIAAAASCGAFKVGISYLVCGGSGTARLGNIREIALAAELAVRLGCTYIEFKAELNPDHFIRFLPESDLIEVRRQLRLAQRVVRHTPVRMLTSSSLNALLAGTIVQNKNYHWCPSAWLRTTISPSGVFVCAYHRGQEQFRIGDLQEATFTEMWTRMSDQIVNPAADCGFHCARHDSNLTAFDGIPETGSSRSETPDWFI
jgi:molybdenum cofactor biosynthesis enzyme MoaA